MKYKEVNSLPKLKTCKKFGRKRNQNIEELKQQLTTAKQFVEYFVVLGLDPKISIESFLYDSSLEDLENLYSSELKPEIITKYPPINKSYINVNDNLSELCFPNGFKLEKYDNGPPKPEILKFLLGNYFYSIDHPLKYITCLKFYESLDNYYTLYKKLKNSLGINILDFRKSSKHTSIHKLFKDNIDNNDNNDGNMRNSTNNRKDLKDILIKNKSNIIKESDFNKYYFPKIIAFVSLKPFYKYQEQILYQIYDYYKSSNKLEIPLEKIVLNIICNIPTPPRGLNVFSFQLNDNFEKIELKSNKMNKLNNIDDDLINIIKSFGVNNFIEIFRYTIFETKTIVFGMNANDLCIFINVLMSIVYPFTYPFQVSSSVNHTAFEVLESISPYIIGINQKYSEDFFKDNKIEIKGANVLIIDLDKNEFTMKYVDEIPNIPNKLLKKLKVKIENNLKKNEKNKDDENEENWVCYPFFDFFINVLFNYGDFLNNDNLKKNFKISSLKVLFKIKEFLDSFPNNERPFYKKLTQTQMFNDFIFKKMIPKDVNDKLEILFFDESINKKNNKKLFKKNKPILFLNSKEYEYKVKYPIPIVKELTTKEKKRYKDEKYILNSLILGQDIIIEEKTKKITIEDEVDNDNDNDSETDKKNNKKYDEQYYFNYILFPKFNKDYFNDPSDYFLYTPDIGDINRINTDLLAKSHIATEEKDVDYQEMQEYIYLTYIEVWGYSYWYQDIIERDYRFEQMLEVLDKIKHQEIELINILFEALNKFQDKEKIIRLYEKILEYKITPNNNIYSIVGKIANRKERGSIDSIDSRDSVDSKREKKKKDKRNFPKRTFKSEDETNILFDDISFDYMQECPECNKIIDIENISTDYKKMKKEILWTKCPLCLNDIKPQLTINFGKSISSKSSYFPCSKVETITLCSPYELKNTIQDIVNKDKFRFLEVEKFKEQFKNLFWGCIWYFKLNNLDYNIMLPYEVNIFKPKTNHSSGINFNYISSKILQKNSIKSKNSNDISNDNNDKIIKQNEKSQNIINDNNKKIINENQNNKNINGKNNILFIIQNINSFCYLNNVCYDYFGKFTQFYPVEEYNDYIINRKGTFKKNMPNTISEFLNKGGNKTFSAKNINQIVDSHRSPTTVVRKNQNNNFKDNVKEVYQCVYDELEEYKYEKQCSEEVNNNLYKDDLNEINEIKPIKILKSSRNSNLSNSQDSQGSQDEDNNSNSSINEENKNG